MVQDASWAPSAGGLPDTSNETLGYTHNLLEGLHIPSGLETPQDPMEELECVVVGGGGGGGSSAT